MYLLIYFRLLALLCFALVSSSWRPLAEMEVAPHLVGTAFLLYEDGTLHRIRYANGSVTRSQVMTGGIPKEALIIGLAGVSVSNGKIAVAVPGQGIWLGALGKFVPGSTIKFNLVVDAIEVPGRSIALDESANNLAYLKVRKKGSAAWFPEWSGDLVVSNLESHKVSVVRRNVFDNSLLWMQNNRGLIFQQEAGGSTMSDGRNALLSSVKAVEMTGTLSGYFHPRYSRSGSSFVGVHSGDNVRQKDYRLAEITASFHIIRSIQMPSDLFFDLSGWYGMGLGEEGILYIADDLDNLELRVQHWSDRRPGRSLSEIPRLGLLGGAFVPGT